MEKCSNCFNGCADIISDKCVKYTGPDIPGLSIFNGSTLLTIELQLTQYIENIITGDGIIPVILPEDLCALVSSFLPVSGPITLNDIISALFRTVCNLDGRVTTAEGTLVTLNANYVIDCLSGVTPSSGTHAILQATIDKLCLINNGLTTLAAELTANYVLKTEIDNYIATYLANIPTSTLYNTKMIPYMAVPYFGPTVGFFDITGAGIGDWVKIYLCNGQNLTPDLRGRVLVGATTMGNTAFNPAVDPGIPGNPTYAVNDTTGANQAFLTSPNQIPLHTHNATVTINDPQHTHTFSRNDIWLNSVNSSGSGDSVNDFTTGYSTSAAFTGLKGTGAGQNVFVDIGNTGQSPSEGHNNIQPVHATNYIIYIP